MCCDDKFLFFINMRIFSLIFAWIAVVLTGLLTLGLFITDLVYIDRLIWGMGTRSVWGVIPVIVLTYVLVHAAAMFTATVFLLVGIHKNKPLFLKGYMIYGMVHLSLFIIQQIILEAMDSVYYSSIRIVITIAVCFYVCILFILYKTYKQMVTPTPNVYTQQSENAPMNNPPQHATNAPLYNPPQHAANAPLYNPPQHATNAPLFNPPQHATNAPLYNPPQHTANAPLYNPPQHTANAPLNNPPQYAEKAPLYCPPQQAANAPLYTQQS